MVQDSFKAHDTLVRCQTWGASSSPSLNLVVSIDIFFLVSSLSIFVLVLQEIEEDVLTLTALTTCLRWSLVR